MAKVLHITASPRSSRSYSLRAADAFVAAYAAARPGDEIETLDLWQEALPAFDGDMLDAKYAVMGQAEQTPGQAEAWGQVKAVIDRFAGADLCVISTPMWNFGIPYKLKHYIDIIAQPGLSFGFDPARGYFGLLADRPVVVVCARGGAYPAGSEAAAIDYQLPYLRHMLGFMGIDDVHEVLIEPALTDGDAQLAAATEKARALAGQLAQAMSAS